MKCDDDRDIQRQCRLRQHKDSVHVLFTYVRCGDVSSTALFQMKGTRNARVSHRNPSLHFYVHSAAPDCRFDRRLSNLHDILVIDWLVRHNGRNAGVRGFLLRYPSVARVTKVVS